MKRAIGLPIGKSVRIDWVRRDPEDWHDAWHNFKLLGAGDGMLYLSGEEQDGIKWRGNPGWVPTSHVDWMEER